MEVILYSLILIIPIILYIVLLRNQNNNENKIRIFLLLFIPLISFFIYTQYKLSHSDIKIQKLIYSNKYDPVTKKLDYIINSYNKNDTVLQISGNVKEFKYNKNNNIKANFNYTRNNWWVKTTFIRRWDKPRHDLYLLNLFEDNSLLTDNFYVFFNSLIINNYSVLIADNSKFIIGNNKTFNIKKILNKFYPNIFYDITTIYTNTREKNFNKLFNNKIPEGIDVIRNNAKVNDCLLNNNIKNNNILFIINVFEDGSVILKKIRKLISTLNNSNYVIKYHNKEFLIIGSKKISGNNKINFSGLIWLFKYLVIFIIINVVIFINIYFGNFKFCIKIGKTVILALIIFLSIELINQIFIVPSISTKLRFNSIGLRMDSEIKNMIQDNRKKILFLGNSITLGKGIPHKDLFTTILDNKFDKYRVINAGYDAGDILQLKNIYFKELYKLKPKLVIWIPVPGDFDKNYNVNDLNKFPFHFNEAQKGKFNKGIFKIRYSLTILETLKFLNLKLRKYATAEKNSGKYDFSWEDKWYTDIIGKHINPEFYKKSKILLQKLNSKISKDGKLICITVPPREFYHIYTNNISKDRYNDLQKMCSEINIEYIDLIDDICNKYKKPRPIIFNDKVHYNIRGHKILSQFFEKIIRDRLDK